MRYEYNSGADDNLSRVSFLADDASGSVGTHLAEYTYLGLGMAAKVDYTEPDVRMDLAFGTGDDPYEGGLDRFDRVQDLLWRDYGASADAARIKHGYDRAGNRLWREDPVAAANSKDFDELYAYDGLYRLSDFQRGNLNSTKDAIASGTLNFAQDWGFDPLGNWLTFDEDSDGDGTPDLVQTREFNKVNEITDIDNGGWVVPAYDRNGNMTTLPQPAAPTSSYTATYDAWNRLMSLSDGSNTVAEAHILVTGFRSAARNAHPMLAQERVPRGVSRGSARAAVFFARSDAGWQVEAKRRSISLAIGPVHYGCWGAVSSSGLRPGILGGMGASKCRVR